MSGYLFLGLVYAIPGILWVVHSLLTAESVDEFTRQGGIA